MGFPLSDSEVQEFLYQDLNTVDLSKLSARSSTRIVAKCPVCQHEWHSSKRNLRNNGCVNCSALRRQLESSYWNTEMGSVVESKWLHKKPEGLIKKPADQLLTFRCPTCETVFQKYLKTVHKALLTGVSPCGVCNPQEKVRSGVLALENYPVLAERLVEEPESDFLLHTHNKMEFAYDCGHTALIRPIYFLRNGRNCRSCLDAKPQSRKEAILANPSVQSFDNGTACIVCSKCSSFLELRGRASLGKLSSGETYTCVDCLRVNPPLAPLFETLGFTWDLTNTKSVDELTTGSAYRARMSCSKGHAWEAHVYSLHEKYGCPSCGYRSSVGEQEVADFLLSLGVTVIQHDRTVITPLELDMYLPDQGIAVEYNGLYWHSDVHRDKNSHRNKWKACSDKDIQLVTVWEDDWQNRRAVVESMLLSKLELDSRKTVFARKTTPVEIPFKEYKEFCVANHIQGEVQATVYLGLMYKGSLVAVSGWKRIGESEFELVRYCTSHRVVGGMGKLIKSLRVLTEVKRIVTFSDNEVSTGKSYATLGFTRDGDVRPDYKYVVRGERVHKFNYRKSRFRDDPELQFEDGLSESQLATLNGLTRVWDCGKVKWVLSFE